MDEQTLKPIKVIIIDDHPIVRQGVRSLLSNCPDIDLCGDADNAAQGLRLVNELQPNVVLLDIRMPGGSGISIVQSLLHQCHNCKVLMLTSFDDDESVTQALQAGAHGYILKNTSDETLADSIRTAYHGQRVLDPVVMDRMVKQLAAYERDRTRRAIGLTDNEIQLLKFVAMGYSNPKIALAIYASEATVKRKLQSIFDKLGVSTRTQAVNEATRRGFI